MRLFLLRQSGYRHRRHRFSGVLYRDYKGVAGDIDTSSLCRTALRSAAVRMCGARAGGWATPETRARHNGQDASDV